MRTNVFKVWSSLLQFSDKIYRKKTSKIKSSMKW